MNKKQVFAFLGEQDPDKLLTFLEAAYQEMNTEQRRAVFGKALQKSKPLPVDGESLLADVKKFRSESRAGRYYEPFDINSKNFMHIPEETNAWFERVGDLLGQSARLSEQGDHVHAVACFRILYELVDAMENGEEIVFADEYGGWMIRGDQKKMIAAYLTSLAATATPEEYAAAALPLIRRDSFESFSKKTYTAAVRAADKAQKAHLKAEVERQGIPTRPGPRN
ncbi:MAG TPA: hypothetical protein VMY37_30440 [Thermoguttaceae bacterium]|nr:hypothetical protein [Thermoguttaceae bacterium]